MKRQFMKSLSAFCTSIMMLVAASSLVVSCYNDSKLWEEMENVQGQLTELEKSINDLKTNLAALTAKVDGLYTLTFQTSDANELQYSFDGGKTWKGTGIVLASECDCKPCDHVCVDPCSCPEVSLVDNGDSVVITVGEASFTIQKPEEIAFEIRSGKLYFASEGTMAVAIKSTGIEDLTVMAAPKGWWAEINSEGKLEITAPDYESTKGEFDYETWEELPGENAASGYVKVHACGADGKCMVGKVSVEVTGLPLVVKAYNGNAYFTVVGSEGWPPTFYYGVSLKENLEADTKDLLSRLEEGDWSLSDDYPTNYGDEFEVEASIAELLGEEPQVGQEYVVWAVIESYSNPSYELDDLVYAYYSPVQVTITENEAERSAYNVTVDVEVLGADSYVAVAMPEAYCASEEDLAYQKEQMVMAMAYGEYYGKVYTENYSGSALDIAAETSYSMTGNYAPDSDVYVMILPIDGRPVELYTVEDVVSAKFTTAPLQAGGSIDVTAAQVTEYMGKVYSYEIWDYVDQLIKLDPYTQLGVEVTPSATDNWSAFYYSFLTPEQWADYGAYDEDLVDLLLEGYGMTPSEIKSWPTYLVEKVAPATTVHFVAFIVDKDGKYGSIAKVELTSEELVKADFAWAEPIVTNLTDGVLKNTTTLEFTPAFEAESPAAASYKYVSLQTTYYNPYEGMDDAQVAEELYFSTSSTVKTISAEELVDGKILVPDHKYGSPYYLAVLPIDAEGNPGASAYIMEYDCVFEIVGVITEGEAYEATEPTIVLNLPAESECYPDYEWGDGAYYGYAYSEWDECYQYYYEVGYTMTPVEGTEVCTVIADGQSYDFVTPSVDTKTGNLWAMSYGSWKTAVNTTEFESSLSYYNHYDYQPAPDLYILVSWKDAEGNYYYKEIHFQEEMQAYADKMTAMINGESTELPTPDGKQWAFNWTAMGMGDLPAVLDFGVSSEGQCVVAYDPVVMGAPEGTPYTIFNLIGYEFEATDATSGTVTLISTNMYGEEITQVFEYSNLTENSCYFSFGEDSFVAQDVDGTLTEVKIDMSGGVMM